MRTTSLFAMILIVVGVVSFGGQGITHTTGENIVDLSPLKMTAEKTETFLLPPIVGAVAFVGGISLLALVLGAQLDRLKAKD